MEDPVPEDHLSQEYLVMMRRMTATERLKFQVMVAPHIDTTRDRDCADALARAIGEISPDEAFLAYLKYKSE
jgi:hypothetical protein